jgi:ribonuclease P protein component
MPSDYSFQTKQRLVNATEFSYVFNKPCRSSDAYFVLLGKPNQLEIARLGLAIARRRVRLASERNRIKRIVRESFRHNPQLLRGIDCVVMAQTGIEQINNQILFHSLTQHWQRITQRCKKSLST